MVPDDDERELKRFLSEAHAALDPETPDFTAMLAAARQVADRRQERSRARLRWVMAGGAVILVFGVYGLLAPRRASEGDAATAVRWAESLGAFRGPTDFLGRPPGAELLRDMPRFGFLASELGEPTQAGSPLMPEAGT